MFDSEAAYRSCESGMRYSAVQPSESTAVATSHTASHASSSLPSLEIAMSIFTPAGFTPNSNPERRSWYESIITQILSAAVQVSRRASSLRMLSGWGSWARTNT